MSLQLIHDYYNQVDRLKHFSGVDNEAVISQKFGDLVNAYCQKKNLELVPQLTIKINQKNIRPDGVVKTSLRLDFGYWESKANVDLDNEIKKKIKAGYPLNNTLFEDSKKIILYQEGRELSRCSISDATELDNLLNKFISVEPAPVRDFNAAVVRFKKDIPAIVSNLKEMIRQQETDNLQFQKAQRKFLRVCKESINAALTIADINEMLIQHILTEEIFISIFSDAQFHRENNIARELYKVEETFFTGTTKHTTLNSIRHYYDIIKARANEMVNYQEKQYFLKVIYESFYKSYNPKAADKLGIVYTPNEIVKFMLASTDFLLIKYFNKALSYKNVEILDPSTGTGTFITELIENFIQAKDLAFKYKNEIHANEVAILPYYIANLNIEYTFQQKMNYYEPYPNICFVDTLDNVDFINRKGQGIFNFGLGAENAERIRRQNQRKISVIIGNPPYNANQANENDNNKNRAYEVVDKRIKETFIHHSKAQKTKVYDMYARFFRWAMDRIDENGIISFITNRSFISSRTFDGFRKVVQDEFDYCYIYDTQSDVRANSRIAGSSHNVFGIQTGVAMLFLVRKKESVKKPCQIFYHTLQDEQLKKEKLEIIAQTHLGKIAFQNIYPDKDNNWLDLSDNDFDTLIPLVSKEVKANRNKNTDQSVFKMFTNGIISARDSWVYDDDPENLAKKISFFVKKYNANIGRKEYDETIKWSEALKNCHKAGHKIVFSRSYIRSALYRPFTKKFLYADLMLNDRLTGNHQEIFGKLFNKGNLQICFLSIVSSHELACMASDQLIDFCLLKQGNGGTQGLPLYTYNAKQERLDNITDWGLEQFRKQYTDQRITKEDIFYYTYAVLHYPAYRKKYESNLKREFPRLPFFDDFFKWRDLGKKLLLLHLNFEQVPPYKLKRVESGKAIASQGELIPRKEESTLFTIKEKLSPKLKTNKEKGEIEIDEMTTLKGIPTEAWDYKLGDRSALDWITDQYKEKKSKDATIKEKFSAYRFADYKEQVIELLMKICTVSIETVKIIRKMS
jgi:predicted helicase